MISQGRTTNAHLGVSSTTRTDHSRATEPRQRGTASPGFLPAMPRGWDPASVLIDWREVTVHFIVVEHQGFLG